MGIFFLQHISLANPVFHTYHANIHHTMDDVGVTVLHWAAYKGRMDVLGSYNYYDNSNNRIGINNNKYEYRYDCGRTLSSYLYRDVRTQTTLHLASLWGHIECVRFRLEHVVALDDGTTKT
jgi:ankyrin repeat protein